MNTDSGAAEDGRVKRRDLLRFGTIASAATGASALSAVVAGGVAAAAPFEKGPPTSYIPTAEKGTASGVATLNNESKIPITQLPDLSATFGNVIDAGLYATLAAAVNAAPAGSRVVLRPGITYEISATISTSTSDLTIDGQGASVRLANGAETSTDRILWLRGTNQVVENVNFGPRLDGTTSASTYSYNIRLDGRGGRVRNCRFTTGTKYAVGMVSGADHTTEGNHMTGSGVLYAWGTVKRTRTVGNTIINAPHNALSGIGNDAAGGYAEDCVVSGNIILTPISMGIEDQQKIRRTTITGNKIVKPGFIPISAPSYDTLIEGNTIIDPSGTGYGIELAADGSVCGGNIIKYVDVVPTSAAGIAVNNHAMAGKGGAVVCGNTIEGAYDGVALYGLIDGVTISNNQITDPIHRGITSSATRVDDATISGNRVRFTKPATTIRDGIVLGSSMKAVTLSNNSIFYTAASAGGAFQDYAIRPHSTGAIIVGNIVDGGGRRDAYKPRVVATSPVSFVVAIANSVRNGATLESTNMTAPVFANNNTN